MAGEGLIKLGNIVQRQAGVEANALLDLKNTEDTLAVNEQMLAFDLQEQERFQQMSLQSSGNPNGFAQAYTETFSERADTMLENTTNAQQKRMMQGKMLQLRSNYQKQAQTYEFNQRLNLMKVQATRLIDDYKNDTFLHPENADKNLALINETIAGLPAETQFGFDKDKSEILVSAIDGELAAIDRGLANSTIDEEEAAIRYKNMEDRFFGADGRYAKAFDQEDLKASLTTINAKSKKVRAQAVSGLSTAVTGGEPDQMASFRQNGAGSQVYEDKLYRLANLVGGEEGSTIISEYETKKAANLEVYGLNRNIDNGDLTTAAAAANNICSSIPVGEGARVAELTCDLASRTVNSTLTAVKKDPNSYWYGLPTVQNQQNFKDKVFTAYNKQAEQGIKPVVLMPSDRDALVPTLKTKSAVEVRTALKEFEVRYGSIGSLPDGTPADAAAFAEIVKNPLNTDGINPLYSFATYILKEDNLDDSTIVIDAIRTVDEIGEAEMNKQLLTKVTSSGGFFGKETVAEQGENVELLFQDAMRNIVNNEIDPAFVYLDNKSVAFATYMKDTIRITAKQMILKNRTGDIGKAVEQATDIVLRKHFDNMDNHNSASNYLVPKKIGRVDIDGNVIRKKLNRSKLQEDARTMVAEKGILLKEGDASSPEQASKAALPFIEDTIVLGNMPGNTGVRAYYRLRGHLGFVPVQLGDGSYMEYNFIDVMEGVDPKPRKPMKMRFEGNK